MSSRTKRKNTERKIEKEERREKATTSVKNRIEEFKLNRQGKTKRKRTDVQSRYRRIDRILSLLILIVVLALIIVWIYILFI